MKIKILNSSLRKFYKKHPIAFLLTIIYFLSVIAGIVSKNYIGELTEQRIINLFKIVSAYNGSISKLDIFFYNSFINLIIFFLVFFFGLCAIGVPFILIINAYKGFGFGFTIGIVCGIYGFKGLLISFLIIIPQAILLILLLVKISEISLSFSYSIFKSISIGARNKYELRPILEYSRNCFIIYLFSFFAVIYEVYISPYFIKIFFN